MDRILCAAKNDIVKKKTVYIDDNMCTIYKLMIHKMQNILLDQGYRLVHTPEEAEVIFAGVCAAFDADEDRSVALLERMKKAGCPIYVYGCMTKISPEKIDLPYQYASWEADKLIKQLTEDRAGLSYHDSLPTEFRKKNDYRVYNPTKRFVGISTGCSYECSYCPHKIGAGEIQSIARKDVIAMVSDAVTSGGETIVLTGIDTACYGSDIDSNYYELLKDILKEIGFDVRIHIAQFNPEGLFLHPEYPDLMLSLWSDPRIRDIQLPIQTGSQRLLSLMNRNYNLNELDQFLRTLKAANPNGMLRTDLMVGFPTETIQDLDDSIAFAIRHYSEVAVYTFEMKKGTPVSDMGLPQISSEEAGHRLEYVNDKLHVAGILVHHGGQDVKTLLKNDRKKEALER